MKIPFKEIANQITGLSTPIFGISWNPPILDAGRARKIIIFLEDRRVLYNPYHTEFVSEATSSVLNMRERLTTELEELNSSSPLSESLRIMRAACRKFLDTNQNLPEYLGHDALNSLLISKVNRVVLKQGQKFEDILSWNFLPEINFWMSLGELRAVFGLHIAQLSIRYGIDLEEQLASIIPISSDSEG